MLTVVFIVLVLYHEEGRPKGACKRGPVRGRGCTFCIVPLFKRTFVARENYFDTPEPIWLRLFYFHSMFVFLFVLQFASALSPTFAKTLSLPGDLRANHFQVTFAF